MKIEKAKIKDVPKIAEYGFELLKYHQSLDIFFTPDKDAEEIYRDFFKKCVYSRNNQLLVAKENDKIVGYALGGVHPRMPFFMNKKIGSINDMFIKKEFRNKGISKLFLLEMKKWFRSKKIEQLELSVHIRNEIGRKVWLKYGFSDYMIKQRIKLEELFFKK